MWIAKFVIKHDCILGNRCERFKVTLQSVNFSVFKKSNSWVTSSMHCMSGNPNNIDLFVRDLGKDRDVLKLERKGNIFFLLEKAKDKAVQFHNPKIIFVKPVLIDDKGYETWEVGSWDKQELLCFTNHVRRRFKDFRVVKLVSVKMDNVFFPRLIPNLTQKQRHAIESAISNGYYQTPRKVGLRKLAKINGLSLSTYQQHLRAAEEKLIPNILHYPA